MLFGCFDELSIRLLNNQQLLSYTAVPPIFFTLITVAEFIEATVFQYATDEATHFLILIYSISVAEFIEATVFQYATDEATHFLILIYSISVAEFIEATVLFAA